jgi:hypothetical protein
MVSTVAISRNGQAALARLKEMRDYGGAYVTRGLTDEIVLDFLPESAELMVAIDRGYDMFVELKETHADLLVLDESELPLPQPAPGSLR